MAYRCKYVDISIAKRSDGYYLIVVDAQETNEAGPFVSREDAKRVQKQLLVNAQKMAAQQSARTKIVRFT